MTIHRPVLTSQEAADIRGVDLASGAKALILKTSYSSDNQNQYHLAVFSASQKFSSKEFRKIIGTKKMRFAKPDEVYSLSGCISGAVPPFGNLFIEPIPTYVDESLSLNEFINFNCGLRTHSI